MIVPQKITQKNWFRWLLRLLAVALIGVLPFWPEIRKLWELAAAFPQAILNPTAPTLPLDLDTFRAGGALLVVYVGAAILFYFALLLVSQFVLPTSTWTERRKVAQRLRAYLSGHHGPAIFVKEGKVIAKQEELKRTGPGVALIDLCSAMALERDVPAAPLSKAPPKKRGLTSSLFNPQPAKPILPVRIAGPGIAFTEQGERIRGVVDLRRQFRISEKKSALTRNGIEVTTRTIAIFTIGQPADTIWVTEELDIIQLADKKQEYKAKKQQGDRYETVEQERIVQFIRASSDRLDEDHRNEIKNYLQSPAYQNPARPQKVSRRKPPARSQSPFIPDEQRIFAAVYAKARHALDDNVDEWTDLPCQAAYETFRNMLAKVEFDYLYQPDEPNLFPMKDFKAEFGFAVRQQGVLSYQVVRRRDGKPVRAGEIWQRDDYEISPAQSFRSSRLLRDRGIKIIFAGFSGLEPVNEAVRQRLREHWHARWQKETAMTLADYDLQSIRVRNRARVQAQQEMTFTLSQIFQTSSHTKEALAWRLFQALERAAADPATRQLLPGETIKLLTTMRGWLFPEESAAPPGSLPPTIDGQASDQEAAG